MAQKVDITLVDDLDGGPAAETVIFGLDGKTYEIDLTEANAKEFRDGFVDYLSAARRAGTTQRPKGLTNKTSKDANKELSKSIREWAATQEGLSIGDRGRIPSTVVAAYQAAH